MVPTCPSATASPSTSHDQEPSPQESSPHAPKSSSTNNGSSTRKPHRKSRGGCAECRRRRVKCDEQKPECGACKRHDVTCVYRASAPRPTTSAVADPTATATSGTTITSGVGSAAIAGTAAPHVANTGTPTLLIHSNGPTTPRPPLLISTDPAYTFSMADLHLLHHWTSKASLDIYQTRQLDYCWQDLFPQIGFQHPFVMHGILSLSALHLAHTDQTSRFDRIMDASRHHNISSQGFRRAIVEMDAHASNRLPAGVQCPTSDALFACAVLNIIYALAMLRPSMDQQSNSRSRYSRALGTELIPLIRGVEAVLQPTYPRVCYGPLRPLTELGNWDDIKPGPDTDDHHLQRIREMWTQGSPTASQADIACYDDTLYILRRCRLYIEQFTTMDAETLQGWGCNRGWAGPLLFLYTASDEYFARLRQRHPPALVLFAYFGALLHHLDSFWFVQGWGCDIVMATDELLGEYWDPWLDWPKQTVGIR